jgi:hypothetical protein
VPVNPAALVADVALVAVSALPVTLPVRAPLNVVAVTTPEEMLIPLEKPTAPRPLSLTISFTLISDIV